MNSILFVLLNIFAVVIIYSWFDVASKKFRSRKLSFPSVWRLVRMPVILATLTLTPYFLVQSGFFEPDVNSLEDRIDLLESNEDFQGLSIAYLIKIKEQEEYRADNTVHFKLVHNYRRYFQEEANKAENRDRQLKLDKEGQAIDELYSGDLIPSPQREIFLSMHYVNTGRLNKAKKLLDRIEDPEARYYNYTLGRYYKRINEIDSAIFFIEWEVEFHGAHEASVRELSALYYRNSRYLPLKELVYSELGESVHFYFRRLVFFIEKDVPAYFKSLISYEISKVNPIGTSAAFLIAFIWLFYIRKLDIFEPERWVYVMLAFVLGGFFTEFVYPLTDALNVLVGFDLNGKPLNDFLYCFIGIGVIEELIKAIPLVIIVLFTREADEPYDFILYAAASALGFAFVENISYLESSELQNINGRMLTAAVAHMSFSSAVAYGVLLSKFVYQKHRLLTVIGFFLLASLAHGFYDFWLINEWASKYSGFTVIFFIGTVHLWFIMKNNAINISNYFDSKIKMNNDLLKDYLIVTLVFVLMFSYTGIAATRGTEAGNSFLYSQLLNYLYFILYLTYSFSRFDVVRGYLAPFTIPFDFMIPRLKETPNYSETRLAIGLFEINPWTQSHEPHHKILRGKLTQRKTVDGNKHWYLFRCDYPVSWEGKIYDCFLVRHYDRQVKLNSGRKCLVQVMVPEHKDQLEQLVLSKHELRWISWGVSKAVSE